MKTIKNGGYVSWGETNYIIPTKTGLKEYYVSKTNYNGPFGTKNVLSARGSGNARFNVMALSDYNNGTTYDFETAKSITLGNWSTPTYEICAIIGGQLGITTSNYSGYGLKNMYWTSSDFNWLGNIGSCMNLGSAKLYNSSAYYKGTYYYVRLYRSF